MDIENSGKNNHHDDLEDPFYDEDPYNDEALTQQPPAKEPEQKPQEKSPVVQKEDEKPSSPKKPPTDQKDRTPTETSKQQNPPSSASMEIQKKTSDNTPKIQGDFPMRSSNHSEYLVHFYIKDVPYTDKQRDIKTYLQKMNTEIEKFGPIKEISVSDLNSAFVSFAIGMLYDSNAQQAIDKIRLKQLFGIERKGNELYLEPSRAFALQGKEAKEKKMHENRKIEDSHKSESSLQKPRDDDYRDKDRRSPRRDQDKYNKDYNKDGDRRTRDSGRDGDRKQDVKAGSAAKEHGRDRSRSGSKSRRRSYDRGSPRRDYDKDDRNRKDYRSDRDRDYYDRKDDGRGTKDDRDKYGRNTKDDGRDTFKRGGRSRSRSKSKTRSRSRGQGRGQKRSPDTRGDSKRYEKVTSNKNQPKDQKGSRESDSLKVTKSQSTPTVDQSNLKTPVTMPQFNPTAAPNLLAQNLAGIPGLQAPQMLQWPLGLNPFANADPQAQAQLAAVLNAQLMSMGAAGFNPQDLAQFQAQQQNPSAIPIQKPLNVATMQNVIPPQNPVQTFVDPAVGGNAMDNQSIGSKLNPPMQGQPMQPNTQMMQQAFQQPPPPQNVAQRTVSTPQQNKVNPDTVSFIVGIPLDFNEHKVISLLQKQNFEVPVSHEWLKEGNMEYLKLVFPTEQGTSNFLRSDFKISVNESTAIPVIALPYLPELSILSMVGFHQMRVDSSETIDLESLMSGLNLSFNDIVDIIQQSDKRFVLVCTKPIQKLRETMEKKDMRVTLKNGRVAVLTVNEIEKPESVVRKTVSNNLLIKKRSGQLNASVESKPDAQESMQEEGKNDETGEGGKHLKITNRRGYNEGGRGDYNQNYRNEGGKGGYYRKNQNTGGNYGNRQRNYDRDDGKGYDNSGNYRGNRNQYDKKPRGQNYSNK